jgi:hypothetical protein
MAKAAPDTTLDGMLDQIALADEMYVCTTEPANYAGIAALILVGPIVMAGGDFVKANGDVSGRKITVAAKNGQEVLATGSAGHIVLATGGATDLIRYITTCAAQTLTDGNTANIGSWKVEVADPTP